MNNRLLAVTVLSASLAAGACGLAFREPVVELESISVGSIGLRGGTLVANVHIDNPNGFDLRSERLIYRLEVARPGEEEDQRWEEIAEGVFDEEIRVPGDGSQTVRIPIDFSYSSMGGVLRAMMDRGTFEYRVSGSVDVRDPITRTVPYRRTGTVSLSGID